MKYLNLILIVTLGFVCSISCSPDDGNVFIDTTDSVAPGIVLRTLSLTGTSFDFFDVPGGELAVDFEIRGS